MKLLKFLRKNKKHYPVGALKSAPDVRNIKLARVQAISSYPSKLWIDTTMIPTFNQKQLGVCVGMAHAFNDIYQNYKETGKVVKLSPRYLYAFAKQVDGFLGQGTYPKIVLEINKEKGCATEDTVPNNCDLRHNDYIKVKETEQIKSDAYPYRSGGYVEVNQGEKVTEDELKSALYQNGTFPITISVGSYNTNIKKGNIGYHRVELVGYGYNGLKIKNGVATPYGTNKHRYFFKNSWDENWGVQGYGYFDFSKQDLLDIFIQMDIPNEIIEEAKSGPKVVITRTESNSKETLGTLEATYNGKTFTCKTLELPWINNQKNVSCIPVGQYVCTKRKFKNKYDAYYVKDVSGRSDIYIHIGNYYTDISGCILVGKQHIDINVDGVKDVSYSTITLKALIDFFGGQDFTLIIK